MCNGNDYHEFEQLPSQRQRDLLDWIDRNLRPIATFNARHTPYGLKHLVTFESDKDSYFTNGEFKGAMLQAGYKVRNKKTQNWVFNVSEQSPVFKVKKAQR